MKKIYSLAHLKWFLLVFSIIVTGCSYPDDILSNENQNPSDNENVEALISYLDNVVLLNNYAIDSVNVVSDEEIHLFTSDVIDSNQLKGKVIVYTDSIIYSNNFVGRVESVRREGSTVVINTKLPTMNEVFSQLKLSPELNSENIRIEFTPDSDDDVKFCGVVSNEVWDNLPVVSVDSTSTASAKKQARSADDQIRTPIDVTLKFEAKNNNAFSGNIYYRIKGSLVINKDYSFEMSTHQIVGLDGSFKLASTSTGRKYIPLLSMKNGMTLYTNKLVGIRVKPSLNFFYNGEIKLEAGFKYEVINMDSYVSYENGEFYDRSWDNQRDWFFRVKSLKTQASFGLSLNSDFYAFIFSDKFFQGGVNTVAGIEIAGEKNVGIQFPDIANFDFQVGISPILEVTPFAVIRIPQLKRIEGPTFKVNTKKFTADLIPSIHDMNYQKANKKLHYDAWIKSMNESFVETEESGIALFEKGSDKPLAKGALKQAGINKVSASRASTSNNSFDISNDVVYEIAPYVKTLLDGDIYGTRIEIPVDDRDLLIKLYNETNGDNWKRKDNWCEGNNLNDWFGVEAWANEDGWNTSTIILPDNNLSGDIHLSGFKNLRNIDVKRNNIQNIYIEDCPSLDMGYGFNGLDGIFLQSLTINRCLEGMDQHFLRSANINTIKIQNIEHLGRVFFEGITSDYIEFYNCHFDDQGCSCDYGWLEDYGQRQSNVNTLCFNNCYVGSGRLDNPNGNLIIKNCTVMDNWVIYGSHITITNSTIEGKYIGSFSGSNEDYYKLWRNY